MKSLLWCLAGLVLLLFWRPRWRRQPQRVSGLTWRGENRMSCYYSSHEWN